MRFFCVICVVLCVNSGVQAQDPQFSHLYAIPLFLGPSFAGSTGGTRAAVNARDQWTAIAQEYISYSLSVDHYIEGTNSGAGLIVYQDHAGAGRLTTTYAGLQYAYSINAAENFSLRPGIQLTVANRRIDYSRLIFGDQLSLIEIKDQTIEPQLEDGVNYIDFSSSLLGIYRDYWFGFSIDHLLRPNHSLLGQKAYIPMRFSFYSGGKFSINTKIGRKRARETLYVMLHYNKQDNFNQALLGAYYTRKDYLFGLWYRGIPFIKTYENYINTDAFVFMLGLRKGHFTYLYSYDLTISKLISDSAGSHEITITWNWKNSNSKRAQKARMKVVPCPMQESPWKRYDSQTM